MATRYYITFHSSTYDTTKRYSSCLQILSKDNLVAIGFVMLDEISESFTSMSNSDMLRQKRTWRLLNQNLLNHVSISET